jgi:tRNA threonylcarbamoyladenosine biosynthesis protein TsaE
MGAGKSTLAQGIAAGLGVSEPVSSPTFALVHEYAGRITMWHLDAYRLRHPDEALDLALPELQLCGAVVIEWPEQIGPALPPDRVEVEIQLLSDDERRLTLRSSSARSRAILEALSLAPLEDARRKAAAAVRS